MVIKDVILVFKFASYTSTIIVFLKFLTALDLFITLLTAAVWRLYYYIPIN